MGVKDIAIGRSDVFWLSPHDIQEKPGWNVRDYNDPENIVHIESILQSICGMGVTCIPPLRVWLEGSTVFVSDGHCRLRAIRKAIELGVEIKSVPVMTEGRGTNEADRKFSQLSLNQPGKGLSPMEFARGVAAMIHLGWPLEEIALKLGLSKARLDAALNLLEAPPEVQKMVTSGRVSPTLANTVLKKEGYQAGSVTLANAIDAATQRGKERATAKDIGSSPTGPRVTATTKIARLAELLGDEAYCEFDDETFDDRRALIVTEPTWREIQNLLGI